MTLWAILFLSILQREKQDLWWFKAEMVTAPLLFLGEAIPIGFVCSWFPLGVGWNPDPPTAGLSLLILGEPL